MPGSLASGNPNLAGQFQLNAISVNPAMGTTVLSIYATGVNGRGGVSAVTQGTYPGLDQINVFIPTPAKKAEEREEVGSFGD